MIIYTCNTNNYVENLPTELPEGHTYIVFGMENPPSPWEGRPIHGDEYINDDDPVWSSGVVKFFITSCHGNILYFNSPTTA